MLAPVLHTVWGASGPGLHEYSVERKYMWSVGARHGTVHGELCREKAAPKMREACKRTDLSQDLGPGYKTQPGRVGKEAEMAKEGDDC